MLRPKLLFFLIPAVAYADRKNLVWVQPTLIAEIEYCAWTHDGKLRHA
jgi:bifunctional non-homologous end joining protein LigD